MPIFEIGESRAGIREMLRKDNPFLAKGRLITARDWIYGLGKSPFVLKDHPLNRKTSHLRPFFRSRTPPLDPPGRSGSIPRNPSMEVSMP